MPSGTGTLLALSVASAIKVEGCSGTTTFTFEVKRTGDLSVAQDVAWMVNGTDVNGAEFVGSVLPSGEITFPRRLLSPVGEEARLITVTRLASVTGAPSLNASHFTVI